MEKNFYNIYIDIDSILDFRLLGLKALKVDEDLLLKDEAWSRRLCDSISGISKYTLYTLINTERNAMFASAELTDVSNVIAKAFLDGFDKALSSDNGISITLHVDLKDIELDEASLTLLRLGIESISPASMNIDFVNVLAIEAYDGLIIYDSLLFLENIIILDKDYTGKKLYTPFLLDRMVSKVKPNKIVESLMDAYAPYIDIDYPEIKHFSRKIKK